MTSIPTQYRQRQAEALFVKRQVENALGWTEMQYCEFQYKCGCAYLQNYIPNDPDGIDMLIREKLFWNWWKNRWIERDQQFLLIQFEVGDDMLYDYASMHSPVELAKSIRPTAIALGSSYSILIGEIFDSKHNSNEAFEKPKQ